MFRTTYSADRALFGECLIARMFQRISANTSIGDAFKEAAEQCHIRADSVLFETRVMQPSR